MADIVRVIKNTNFTIMSNKHLKDNKLSLKAKGLLSLVLSLPDDWDYTIKGLLQFARDGNDSFASAFKELELHGYLVRERKRNERGQVKGNNYTFFENPEENVSFCEKLKNSENTHFSPKRENPVQGNPVQEKPVQENPVQLNTNILNTNKLNKYIYNNQSYQSKDNIDSKVDLEKNDKIDGLIQETEKQFLKRDSREDVETLIKDNIDYDFYEDFFEDKPDNTADRSDNSTFAANIGEIDMLVGIIVNTICSNAKAIRIGKQLISHSVVESRFKKIQMKHIEYVLKCLMLSTKDIKNPTAYITTALYNATFTCDFAESNELKNIDPALFIPEQFHDDEFKKKHYEHTSYRP